MKTKIFNTIIALSLSVLGASVVSAAAMIPLSSGIKSQFYSIEWCSPHMTRLVGSPTATCRNGQFQNVSGVAKIVYNGTNFPAGNVGAQTSVAALIPTTRTAAVTSAATPALVDFFSGITGGAFALEGEGVLTLRVFMQDYADNTSFYRVVYKIDKTGPQLSFTDITESTDYTHYGTRVNSTVTVEKNDASATMSSGDMYANPILGSYSSNDTASPRLVHTRPNLHAFYFQNNVSGIGASSAFTANTSYSDDYSGFLIPSATSPIAGGYSGPLVSGAKGFQLVAEDGSPLTTPSSSLTAAYTTANLLSNGINTQKKYRLRLYDNTVNAADATGNYSETAFYAVRDNMSPNMGGNGLAANATDASEMLLSFADATVYDKTAYANGYTPIANGVSRFIAASNPVSLKYKLNDTGISGNGVTSGAGCTDYQLCNAGIDPLATRIKIEDSATAGSFPDFTNFSNRFVNDGTKNKDFSKVDNHMASTNGTYGKYGVQYVSNSSNGATQLCDYVGNCIAPQLAFRVVANIVDNATSNLAISTKTASADGKIIANGTHAYQLSYSLLDGYGNKVVPVVSAENNNVQVKAVDSLVTFSNGLNVNQLRNSGGTGVKLVTTSNLLPAKITVQSSDINGAGTVLLKETALTSPGGVYQLSLSSPVPTNGAYPYLGDSAKLAVQTIYNTTDKIQAAAGITFPATGARMGYGATTANAGASNPMVVTNTGGIGESAGFQNITLDQANYGKVSYVDAAPVTLAALSGRSANFEFASPYVYGLNGMRVLIDGQYGDHFKKLYTIDPSVPNYNVYEKYVVAHDTDTDEQPKWLDYKIRENAAATPTNMSSGIRYTTNGNFPIFGTSMDQKSYDIAGASLTGSGFPVEVQMSSKPTLTYDNTKLRTGFVSAVTYQIPSTSEYVQLPSIGRGLTKADGLTALNPYEMVRNFFDGSYTIGKSTTTIPTTLSSTINDIAIIGLSNQYNTLTTDSGGTQKNVNVEGELNRTALIANIKQNVATVSRGMGAKTATTGKHWCDPSAINGGVISDLYDTNLAACTIDVNGEKIIFVDGNTTLKCTQGSGNTCMLTDKRALIVKNGSLYIKSNISTLNSSAAQTSGQFFMGVMNDTGLANVTIDPTNIDPNNVNIASADMSGWMFVDPAVTNLDAFVFAQGPMVTYDANDTVGGKNILYTALNTTERKLRNQLYINGSILTLNTITGSRQSSPECPYIIDNCTADVSQMFDLVYVRRFTLGSISLFPPFNTADTRTVPYHPDGPNFAKRAGGVTGTNTVSGNELRSITETTYQPYPMMIERDLRWNSSPSRLFQVNR